jgi:hypothetical protein
VSKKQGSRETEDNMVRRKVVVGLLLVLVMVLVGCGGSQTDTTTTGSDAAQPAAGQQFDVGDMPLTARLPMGTLMLEQTEYAVTPEQAQELLPLWQMVKALQESGTASQAESDAVLNQIQEAMTPEQLAAIEDMDPEEMRTLMQDLGMGRRADDAEDDDSDRGGGPPDMGGGGMMPPGGGEMGGMPFGGEGAEGTPAAGQGTMGGFGTAFLEQVIELLEARASEA